MQTIPSSGQWRPLRLTRRTTIFLEISLNSANDQILIEYLTPQFLKFDKIQLELSYQVHQKEATQVE